MLQSHNCQSTINFDIIIIFYIYFYISVISDYDLLKAQMVVSFFLATKYLLIKIYTLCLYCADIVITEHSKESILNEKIESLYFHIVQAF